MHSLSTEHICRDDYIIVSIPSLIIYGTATFYLCIWGEEVICRNIPHSTLGLEYLLYALIVGVVVHISHDDNLCCRGVVLDRVNDCAKLVCARYAFMLARFYTRGARRPMYYSNKYLLLANRTPRSKYIASMFGIGCGDSSTAF